jgi:hypothetical protein
MDEEEIMYIELSVRGMRLAQAYKLAKNEFVAFCPSCDWVAPEKNAAYKMNCPDCRGRLNVVYEQ